jgi:hypothetical protein
MRIAQRFNAGKEVPVVPSPEGTAEWVRYRRSPRPALVKACRQECRRYGRQECLTVTRVFRPIPVGVLQGHPGGLDENSPAFQRWERGSVVPSPEGDG